MNFSMWKKALNVIPEVSKEEWDHLDIISKWMVASRAAALVFSVIAATLAGLFAIRDGVFALLPWLALLVGLVLAHSSNNIFNDFTDYVSGVDKDNYYRTLYGPQPVSRGFVTTRQQLLYFAITGLMAAALGVYLILYEGGDTFAWVLLGIGAFFVLFYTWPLKHFALGEIAVLLVWGPLMVGGGYYIFAHHWSWNVAWASLPYALGVTAVIFGKHIDKLDMDVKKHITTLPALLGEKLARQVLIAALVLPYILVLGLIATRYFTPAMLVVFLAVPQLRKVYSAFHQPKPKERPEGFPDGQGGWPLYFATLSFGPSRSFGMYYILGLIIDIVLRYLLPSFWH